MPEMSDNQKGEASFAKSKKKVVFGVFFCVKMFGFLYVETFYKFVLENKHESMQV